jgi:hypothetical protein
MLPFTVLLGDVSFSFDSGYIVYIKKRSCHMFIAITIGLLLFALALAGADLFIAQYNPDELSNMGIRSK